MPSFCLAREDLRTYYNNIESPTVWINPKKIKIYVYPDETKEYILHNSIKAWDSGLKSDLNFKYVKNPTEADIVIKYVNNLDGKQAGVARSNPVTIQGKKYHRKVLVEIGKYTSDGFKLTDVQLNETALHEMGHAIGILGHSDNPADIMYPQLSRWGNTTLSTKDIETVKKLYGF